MKKELLKIIIEKTERSSSDWKEGAEGNRSFFVHQELYDKVGKTEFLAEARELQTQGMITIEWESVGNDIRKIRYALRDLPRMYELSDIRPKSQVIEEHRRAVENLRSSVEGMWIKQYLDRCLIRLEKGHVPSEFAKRDGLFQCLGEIDRLREPLYKRVFSKYCLGHSKAFENEFQSTILSIARKYHTGIEEEMNDTQILSQLLIEEYSQELALKGPLWISVDGENIDLGKFRYGAVLNSLTLSHAEPNSGQKVKKVLTVENKANYMAMPYDEEWLIIYSHGFFTPKEREFLIKLREVLPAKTQYFHSGDLDYGGIRIYQYIKQKIFPKVQPWQMDTEVYRKYEKYAVAVESGILTKLKRMDMDQIPEMSELRKLLVSEGKALEQESFLFHGKVRSMK
ncbi:Wadjet anti-phage system protein JetD domain-containing protein [Anaerostipes sp.]|uniref:Wadjet anti-phage system protein JetD domain-containing protein n=1 Tax=Anaerostipes sp. TaxID=1872530 RepID=UPI0025C3C87C|nr:Wadjet anti-phage system protein JetD domain-containing protein [Anaerostipes sp.]MBS7007507.1 DUF2399 domain-containing protein [Anaerostipes sp.]